MLRDPPFVVIVVVSSSSSSAQLILQGINFQVDVYRDKN